jgi:hypothetical protein
VRASLVRRSTVDPRVLNIGRRRGNLASSHVERGHVLKRSLALLLVVFATALGSAAPAANSAAPVRATAQPLALVHKCSSRYRHAVIAGEHKCLGSGQFCAKRYEAIYRRHGFTCKPGSDGRLRLHRR